MPLALSVSGLQKTYGSVRALVGVDLEVGEGELVGLLGPNGAGKSTLVKAACGLVHPSAGSVTVCGAPAGSAAAQSALGYLAELFRFPDWCTGEELLALHQRLAAFGRAALRAGQLLMQAQQLVRGAPVGEAEQLGEVAELRVRGGRPGRAPADLHRARARFDEAACDLDERGLSGAVRTQQPEQLAALDLEIDAAQRLHRAIGLVQARDREGSGHLRQGSQAPIRTRQ